MEKIKEELGPIKEAVYLIEVEKLNPTLISHVKDLMKNP